MSHDFTRLALLRADTFRPLIGDTFLLPDEATEMTLVSVKEYPQDIDSDSESESPERDPFALLFEAKHASAMNGGIRRLSHPAFGELSMSMNPVQPPLRYKSSRQPFILYESIFT